MIAHLQAAQAGDGRILQPATAATMQRRQFGHDPRVSGLTYGFMEMTRNGQRLVWHARRHGVVPQPAGAAAGP